MQVFSSRENIGSLSKLSASTMQLADSYITIGGQQYKTGVLNFDTATDLDTGSIANNSLYNLFTVVSGITVILIASLSSTPLGYTAYKKVGFFATDNSSDILIYGTSDKTYAYRNEVSLSGSDGRAITAATEDIHFSGSGNGWTSDGDSNYYMIQRPESTLFITCGIDATISGFDVALYINGSLYRYFAEGDINTSLKFASIVIPSSDISIGDKVSIRSPNDSITIENNTETHFLNIIEI